MNKVFSSELLYRAIDRKRRAERLSWHGAAKEIGVSRFVLHRVAQRSSQPYPVGMAKILAWLGMADESPFLVRPEMQHAVENDLLHLDQ